MQNVFSVNLPGGTSLGLGMGMGLGLAQEQTEFLLTPMGAAQSPLMVALGQLLQPSCCCALCLVNLGQPASHLG
ncbi:GL11414 [Drosophila persimilis]|uniref:GL11414 n=1 Tax=Drosophila persimilis TaxID=7234 RepID=B4GAN6_DROPE|nr:GL11414 [Drosophila persimilis]